MLDKVARAIRDGRGRSALRVVAVDAPNPDHDLDTHGKGHKLEEICSKRGDELVYLQAEDTDGPATRTAG